MLTPLILKKNGVRSERWGSASHLQGVELHYRSEGFGGFSLVPYSLFGACGGLCLVRIVVVGIFVRLQFHLAVIHGSGSVRSNR